MNSIKTNPAIGMALWLMRGKSVADKVEWLAKHGFSSVALLPNDTLPMKQQPKEDAAAAMKEAGMILTYHGNVPAGKLKPDHRLDEDFAKEMIDDIIWWHENAGGVYCCCSDPITSIGADGQQVFLINESARLARLFNDALQPLEIRIGIENSFGLKGRICGISDINRFAEKCDGISIGLLLDAGHANVHTRSGETGGETDLEAFVKAVPLDILEVHLSDNKGLEDEHNPLGYGNLDLEKLFSALKSRGFSGPLTIEVMLGAISEKHGSYIDDPEKVESILASRDAILSAWNENELSFF